MFFFSFCWFSICLCLCSGFLDFCMLHCCQGIVSMGRPVFWIGCLGIHRCNGCACLLMRVLACISSEGSCTASVSTSWKRQGIFVGHSIWYILERARVHSMCACVCVCVLLCVDSLYRWVCVFSSIWGYFRVCCLILYSVMVGCMVRMCKCWDAVFSNCMVAIAFVAESLSFVIEFLGCVMAIFYRIWARAVSTSWRGALHHLYTRGGV